MKKIGNKRFEDFPPAILYIEDIREIIDIVSQECEEIEIRSGDYELSSTDELTELAGCFPSGLFPDISIQASRPYLSIDLRPRTISAYISEDTLALRGVIAKVRDVIEHRKFSGPRKKFITFSSYFFIFLTSGLFSFENYVLSALSAVLAIVLLILDFRSILAPKVILNTGSKTFQPSFLARKKDEIWLAIIAASFGSALTYLVTRFLP